MSHEHTIRFLWARVNGNGGFVRGKRPAPAEGVLVLSPVDRYRALRADTARLGAKGPDAGGGWRVEMPPSGIATTEVRAGGDALAGAPLGRRRAEATALQRRNGESGEADLARDEILDLENLRFSRELDAHVA